MSHLEALCSASAKTTLGARVCGVKARAGGPAIHEAVDKRHLTPMSPNCKFIDVVLDGRRVYGMEDSGANFSLVTEALADELGLEVFPFGGSFTVASGHKNQFAGKLGKVNLQLHDGLVVEVDGIRVIKGRSRLQMILGTDVLGSKGDKLRHVGTSAVEGDESIMVEIGLAGSGELFKLLLVDLAVS